MSALRTITKNVLSNTAGHFVALATALLLTPFVVAQLGDDVYGIWGIVVSLTGYYGILDLGIRSAVGQYVTRYWAQGDIPGLNRTMSTAVAITLPIAGLLLLVSGLIAWLLPSLASLPPESVAPTRTAILITGGAVALAFPFAVFGSATYARQRFDIANAVGIAERLLSVGLAYWVLTAGYGIVGIAATTAGTQLLGWGARLWIAFRMLPGLQVAPRWCSRASLRELWSFGLYNFLINVADRIVLSTDLLVIGFMIPAKQAVTYYSLGGDFVAHFVTLVNSMAWALTPYATSRDAVGDERALRTLWLKGSRTIFLFAAIVGGGLIVLGRDFLTLWVGAKYVSGEPYTSSAVILSVLAVAALLRALMTCGKQILFGIREVRYLAWLASLEAVANLGLSLALVGPFGILGVAIGTLVPIVCTQLILQPMFLAKRLGVPLGEFLRGTLPGGCAVLATMVAAKALLDTVWTVDSWGELVVAGVAVTLPALAVAWRLGMPRDERDALLRRALRRA